MINPTVVATSRKIEKRKDFNFHFQFQPVFRSLELAKTNKKRYSNYLGFIFQTCKTFTSKKKADITSRDQIIDAVKDGRDGPAIEKMGHRTQQVTRNLIDSSLSIHMDIYG
jgi:hypothetical protein